MSPLFDVAKKRTALALVLRRFGMGETATAVERAATIPQVRDALSRAVFAPAALKTVYLYTVVTYVSFTIAAIDADDGTFEGRQAALALLKAAAHAAQRPGSLRELYIKH